jgi:hypothetical protein
MGIKEAAEQYDQKDSGEPRRSGGQRHDSDDAEYQPDDNTHDDPRFKIILRDINRVSQGGDREPISRRLSQDHPVQLPERGQMTSSCW